MIKVIELRVKIETNSNDEASEIGESLKDYLYDVDYSDVDSKLIDVTYEVKEGE